MTDHPVLTTLLPGFVGTALPGWLATRLRNGLGGVCLFGENIESPTQLRALTDAITAANPRAIIAVDEEGGDVTRLDADTGSPSPGNAVLGRIGDLETTRDDARTTGWRLRRAGCTVNFAPSVDVNSRSDNPIIGVRSFAADPERVARHGAAWTEGLQETGIAASAKHFPGHGDTATDSHLALPVVDRSLAELRACELIPFGAAVEAGTRVIMTSHILLPQLDPEHPATMSRTILTGLLREELGFDGVIVTDALDMAGASGRLGMPEAGVRALRAGADLLCLGTESTDEQIAALERATNDAIANGFLDAARVAEAAARVVGLADDLAALRAVRPVPAAEPGRLSVDEVIAAFDLQPAAETWRSANPQHYTVVRVDTASNTAAGVIPWGPWAAVAADPTAAISVAFESRPQFTVAADEPFDPSTGSGQAKLRERMVRERGVLVIGRNLHRHAFARELVDRLRTEHELVLVVDLGWPSTDRAYADVATFGASAQLGQALLTYLARPKSA